MIWGFMNILSVLLIFVCPGVVVITALNGINDKNAKTIGITFMIFCISIAMYIITESMV